MKEKLFDMLMDVLNQACQVRVVNRKIYYWNDMGCSAYEEACGWLEDRGYLKRIKRGKHKGLYKVLKWKWEAK